MNVTERAKILGVARPTLSRVINGKSSISPEMAIRLAKAFGSTAETWIKMQATYDLAQTGKCAKQIKVKRYKPGKSKLHSQTMVNL
ncbi:MAG: HigA family addiction module antitoxin [Nitrospinaceae bacterium]|nr:HigA family addiction module antitoxin [Nitrospinaceae bacterium]